MARWRRRRERPRKTIRWSTDSQGLTKASHSGYFTTTPLFGGSEERRFSLFTKELRGELSLRFGLVGLGLKCPPRASATSVARAGRA